MSTVMYCFRAKNKQIFDNQVETIQSIAMSKQEPVSLQVFMVNGEYIYRLLSAGYTYENYLWKLPKTFPQCNYDNRTDVPRKDKPNKQIAVKIDELIKSEQYEVIPLYDGQQN